MPRNARLLIPGLSHHVAHIGRAGLLVFKDEMDYQEYLMIASRQIRTLPVKIQGWCLLPRKTSLLLFCREHETKEISNFMQQLGGLYTRYFNRRYGGRGTIWNGRFRCSPVQPGQWRLGLVRYQEYLPVLHEMVNNPQNYLWSSHKERMGCVEPRLLTPDPDYRALGGTPEECRRLFRDFIGQGPGVQERELIATAIARNVVTGDSQFIRRIEKEIGIPIVNRGPGRPPGKGGK